jgi:hypothetical protein
MGILKLHGVDIGPLPRPGCGMQATYILIVWFLDDYATPHLDTVTF